MRNYHNLPTCVTFFGLVKDFDTGGHELLIKVLEIHGAPQMFYSAVLIFYQYLIVVLNIENIIEAIIQEVGVIEGDSMAPLSFLFLMATFSEILEDIWGDDGLKTVELQRLYDDDFEKVEVVVNGHTKAQ